MRRTIVVIGGGITGLAAARRLHRLEPQAQVHLLEASSRLGGVLQTRDAAGFLIEEAADGFLTNPAAAVDLCRGLGLGDSLISPNEAGRQAMVVHRGRLQSIPAGFTVMAPSRLSPLLRTPVLSVRGKLRAAAECCIPRRRCDSDESIGSFVRRRFGRELLDRLVQPLISGIYTGEIDRLSLQATMPRLRQMEAQHGSLLRAMLKQRRQGAVDASRGARYGQFASLRGGMGTLIAALAASLPAESLQCDSPAERIAPASSGRQWRVCTGGRQPRRLAADAVIVAAPAHRAATLLADADPELAADLREIDYASCAIASLGYRLDQIGRRLDGFGFVVPLVEGRRILSCSFASVKYPGRAPAGALLMRVFMGGVCQSDLLQLADDQLLELAHRDVAPLLNIRGGPFMQHIVRHARVMPQYHVGHCQRVARIEQAVARRGTLAVAGSAFRGVGVPACIRDGEAAAEQIHASLTNGAAAGAPRTCPTAPV